jgi:hypothetical protein
MHPQQSGVRLRLEIELPSGGWITVKAETLRRTEFGFAVRFLEMSDDAAARLDRALQERGAERD